MKTIEDVHAVFSAIREVDGSLDDFWVLAHDDGSVGICINCSDLFWWATADAEPLEAEDVELYKQTWKDCEEASGLHYTHADSLFCCRKRKERPQDACYKNIPRKLWPLFDAAGPPRAIDKGPFGNPFPRAAEGVS